MRALISVRNFLPFLVAACILVVCVGRSVGQKAEEKKDPEKVDWSTEPPRKAAPGDNELQRLRIERYNAALQEFQIVQKALEEGLIYPYELIPSIDHMRLAALALATTPAERVQILRHARDLFKSIEVIMDAKFEAGIAKAADCEQVRNRRLDAELRLSEEKEKK